MSALYLIRHAQAGPRHKYDTLSALGETQARLLGQHLVAQKHRFAAVYRGSLERQKLTARSVERVYQEAGVEFPEIVEDPRWDEFNLDHVYEALVDPLCRDDPRFKAEYETMMQFIADEAHDVHRTHSYCDIAVVRAWLENAYPYSGESWEGFRARILSPLETLAGYNSGEKVAVFTSATPVGIWVGRALGLSEQQTWRLAGVAYNSGITTLRVSEQDLRLFSFNSTPHLHGPELLSFR